MHPPLWTRSGAFALVPAEAFSRAADLRLFVGLYCASLTRNADSCGLAPPPPHPPPSTRTHRHSFCVSARRRALESSGRAAFSCTRGPVGVFTLWASRSGRSLSSGLVGPSSGPLPEASCSGLRCRPGSAAVPYHPSSPAVSGGAAGTRSGAAGVSGFSETGDSCRLAARLTGSRAAPAALGNMDLSRKMCAGCWGHL